MTKQIDETTGLDISPLIEWAHPNEVAAQAALNKGDKPRSDEEEIKIAKGQMHGDYKGHRAAMKKKHNITEGSDEDLAEDFEFPDEYDGAILVQPVDDLNETFEVVRGGEGIDEGETLSTDQITTLREMGKTVIEQSLLEATYHVHAEVSPRGIPLSHNHRIPINAKSEAEAKSKARKHAKERGWKIHNINKVTLAEDADETYDLVEKLEDQAKGPTKFSEITAPVIESNEDVTPKEQLDESWGVKVHHFDDFKRNAEDYASAKTSHGKVEYQHRVAGPFGDKIPAWHQTSAIVDHPKHGRINIGTFNHKHGKNSPHGHGQVLDSYMADDDD